MRAIALFLLITLAAPALSVHAQAPVRYEQDIQPLLSSHCYTCHGPDGDKRKGDLRLDTLDDAFAARSESQAVILPGNAADSELFQRISSSDPDLHMPPLDVKKQLSDADIALIKRWINEGAQWSPHWAFQPLTPSVPPALSDPWIRNPIDQFVLARLHDASLSPSPEADKRTMIRRLYFDLIGLPPTFEEVEAFIQDDSADAYENLVDQLLNSPRYGERWARHWLDVVHYADTHGYDKDKRRPHAWPYRDYVIRALNADKPYSEFVLQQLAGDVLTPDDPDGIVALGFIAAGPWDFVGHVELREGTVDKDLTRLLDRDDMVTSTMNTFTSLTVQCARCHDHKFDPVSQRDYYNLQAVFAGVEKANRPYDMDAKVNAERQNLIRTLSASMLRKNQLDDLVNQLDSPELKAAQIAVSQAEELTSKLGDGNSPSNGYHSAVAENADTVKWVQLDFGHAPNADMMVLYPARPVDFPDTPGFGFPRRYRIDTSDEESFSNATCLVDLTAENTTNPGDAAVEIPLPAGVRQFVRITATRLWPRTNDFVFALAEIALRKEGQPVQFDAKVTALDSIEAGRWSVRNLTDGYTSRAPLDKEGATEADRETAQQALELARQRRDELVRSLLPQGLGEEREELTRTIGAIRTAIANLPEPELVYAAANYFPSEGSFTPPQGVREISLLRRGDIKQPVEPSSPNAVDYFVELADHFQSVSEEDEAARRAALAQWIVDTDNPLTWRSIVNRIWGYHFGQAIVDTPNDFGHMGSVPSHPELLDWLAIQFRDNGQSLKELHRLIVTSATYRQSSASRPDCAAVDGSNRLLWRMNRQQMDAESIRDAVLKVASKLDITMGGPGFDLFAFEDDHSPRYKYAEHDVDNPESLRRTIYRFTVRSVPDPFMDTLDCADPSQSVPVRNNTITALQALALLNNPFMVRMADHVAVNVAAQTTDVNEQVRLVFRKLLLRDPSPEDESTLVSYAEQHGLSNVCRVIFNTNEFMFVD